MEGENERSSSSSIMINLTGFGEFFGVKENPTETLIQSLTEEEKSQLGIRSSRVLEVSIEGAESYLNEDTLATADGGGSDCIVVNLHLGVQSSATTFVLEEKCYNNKTFRCRDMRGNVFENEKIDAEAELDRVINSQLGLQKIQENLEQKIPGLFVLGQDPGRFLCNYIYYRSSMEAAKAKRAHSLFVHCPEFATIGFEAQKMCLLLLIKEIRDHCSSYMQQTSCE